MGRRKKLTSEQIESMRKMYDESGMGIKEIADAFRVSTTTIRGYVKHGSITEYHNKRAKKKGYDSHYKYCLALYGPGFLNNALKKKYAKSYKEYRDDLAKKEGYRDYNHMRNEKKRKAIIGRLMRGIIQSKSQLEEKTQEQ